MRRGERFQITLKEGRHQSILMAFRWRADDGPTFNLIYLFYMDSKQPVATTGILHLKWNTVFRVFLNFT